MWPFKKRHFTQTRRNLDDISFEIDGKDYSIIQLLEGFRYQQYQLKRYEVLCQKHGLKIDWTKLEIEA